MISQVDDDNSGEIEFAEFLKVIENQKASAAKANDETDTIEAFVALGGNADKTGEISMEKLRAVVKVRAVARTPLLLYKNQTNEALKDFGFLWKVLTNLFFSPTTSLSSRRISGSRLTSRS